jgi:hypothetical protein
MKRTTAALLTLLLATSVFAQQQQQQPTPQPTAPQPAAALLPPNQAALAEAREHAKAGRVAEAVAALERVTPPAPAVLNQLRTSDDFKALRDNPRFQAVVAKLMPCATSQYKEFDFWLGDWEVRSPTGQLLGHNHITKRHGGCVVFEDWEGAAGGTGSSFNVYDPPTKQWHQFWVDASGTNWLSSDKQGNPVSLRGGIRDGAMVMTSHPDTPPSIGVTRATWRPLPDGGLQQTFESSSDGGKTWTASFVGIYKKAKS